MLCGLSSEQSFQVVSWVHAITGPHKIHQSVLLYTVTIFRQQHSYQFGLLLLAAIGEKNQTTESVLE